MVSSPHPSPLPGGEGTEGLALPSSFVAHRAPATPRRLHDRRLVALIWARLRRDPVALAAALLLLGIVLTALLAAWVAPRDLLRQDPSFRLAPPLSPGYPL